MVARLPPAGPPQRRPLTVPYSPQSVADMRARFIVALKDFRENDLGSQVHEVHPDPESIFDFEDGTRLIFGYTAHTTGINVLVMSASMNPGSEAKKKYGVEGRLIGFVDHACRLAASISPISLVFAPIAVMPWDAVQFVGPPKSVVERLAEKYKK